MLVQIKIQNLAIIDSATIELKRGLNILSGETGAGKSIILDAISLILGARAETALIRSGYDQAIIEGVIDLEKLPHIVERLLAMGISLGDSATENGLLIIKRVLSRDGKHRIYINGQSATLSMLSQASEEMVEVCSQHEHQSLLKPQSQLELLDAFGKTTALAKQHKDLASKLRELEAKREAIESRSAERARELDFIAYQIKELEDASLSPNEDETLTQQKKLIQTSRERSESLAYALSALESDSGALDAVQRAVSKLKSVRCEDPSITARVEGLQSLLAQTESEADALKSALQNIENGESSLSEISDRLSLIHTLKRKYGATIEDMLATLAQMKSNHQELSQIEESKDALDLEIASLRQTLATLSEQLLKSRQKAAKKFTTEVSLELQELKMEGAKLEFRFGDTIELLAITNPGEPPKPLSKTASGGELSRIMLAVRRIISDHGKIGVYIFDEIDAGVGGQTAFMVGKKLKAVAHGAQVICITHLPQVAAFADHHLKVIKTNVGKRTLTSIEPLTAKERQTELARMIGGPKTTSKSMDSASELLKLALKN